MRVNYFKATFILLSFTSFIACNSGGDKNKAADNTATGNNLMADADKQPVSEEEKKGIGKFKDIQLTHPLDAKMAEAGKAVYGAKCVTCHKLTEEKLVGPGWKNVTLRHAPEWIMNFITNTDEMLTKNQAAKSLFEICLVKMPNQSLTDDDARDVYEFQRQNDGEK